MVLTASGGDAVHGRVPTRPADRRERGSQALEFALIVPLVGMVIVLVLHAGLFAIDLVLAQTVAREAARAAAVADDAAARDAASEAAAGRQVELHLTPAHGRREPGDEIRARARLRSNAFRSLGTTVWVTGQAVMRAER